MYGDSSQIKRRTDQLRDRGTELTALADRLVARTESVGWRGRAADALHGRITERAATLRDLAGRHVGAADALATHREAVDEAKDEIDTRQERARRLIEDGRAPDDLRPPPDGHRDWLALDLPGL